jgi:hypothetical protein
LDHEVSRTSSLLVQGDEVFIFDSYQQTLHRVNSSGGYALLGPGSGPGELGRGYGAVASYRADSLLVFDPGNRRVSVLHPDAPPGRTVSLENEWTSTPSDMFLGLDDGRLVEVVTDSREWNGVVLRDPEGAVLDSVLRIPFHAPVPIDDRGEPLLFILPDRIVWGRGNHDRLFLGTTESRWIHSLDFQAGTEDSFEPPLPRTATDAAMRRQMEAVWAERQSLSDVPQNLVDRIQLVVPDSLPLVSGIIPLPGDLLLLQGPPEELELDDVLQGGRFAVGGTLWTAVDSDGRVLGRLSLAGGFRPFQVGDEAVFGLTPGGTLGVQVARVELADLEAAVQEMDQR